MTKEQATRHEKPLPKGWVMIDGTPFNPKAKNGEFKTIVELAVKINALTKERMKGHSEQRRSKISARLEELRGKYLQEKIKLGM